MKLIRSVSFLVFGVVIAEISVFWDMSLCKRIIGS